MRSTRNPPWRRDSNKMASGKPGAVHIVRPDDNSEVSMGYNGFPKGVKDDPERYNDRPTKYRFVCHAESNALDKARTDVSGCTMYVSPLHPCAECAKRIIQTGIARVVTRKPTEERWKNSYADATLFFEEAGIKVEFIEDIEASVAPKKPECQHVWSKHVMYPLPKYDCMKCGETSMDLR